jgi:hypothetical protein
VFTIMKQFCCRWEACYPVFTKFEVLTVEKRTVQFVWAVRVSSWVSRFSSSGPGSRGLFHSEDGSARSLAVIWCLVGCGGTGGGGVVGGSSMIHAGVCHRIITVKSSFYITAFCFFHGFTYILYSSGHFYNYLLCILNQYFYFMYQLNALKVTYDVVTSVSLQKSLSCQNMSE